TISEARVVSAATVSSALGCAPIACCSTICTMLGSTATSATSAIAPITAFGLLRPRLTARASHDHPVAGPIARVDMTVLLLLRCGRATMVAMLLHRVRGSGSAMLRGPHPSPPPQAEEGAKRCAGSHPRLRGRVGWGQTGEIVLPQAGRPCP